MMREYGSPKVKMNTISTVVLRVHSPLLWIFLVLLSSGAADLKCQTIPVTALALLPNEQVLTGSDDGLLLHDKHTLEPIRRIETDLEKIYSIKVSPDRNRIAISGGTPAELGIVSVFSVTTFKTTHRFGRFDDVATDCDWISSDRIVACSMTGNCCVMSLEREISAPFNVHSRGVLSILMLDPVSVTTAGMDNTIRVWKLNQHNDPRVLNNHVDVVNQIAARPSQPANDQPMMVTVSDDATVRFWQPMIGRMVRFARLESIPTCVVWNRAGTLAVVGTRTGKIHFLDPATATIVRTISSKGWINCLALSRDEKSIFVGGETGLNRVQVTAK
jgi:WD40 repeat protein